MAALWALAGSQSSRARAFAAVSAALDTGEHEDIEAAFYALRVARLQDDVQALDNAFGGSNSNDLELVVGVCKLKGTRLEDVIDTAVVEVLGGKEARARYPALRGFEHGGDRVVVAPLRRPDLVEALYGGVVVDGGRIAFVFHPSGGRWIADPPGYPNALVTQGRLRHACPVSGCRTDSRYRHEHRRETVRSWFGCLRCRLRSGTPGPCPRCNRALVEYSPKE